ncbi:hypothetical protein TorRG33x02_154420 [Trema orientale]|uniref:SGNH hydrolase-type esterase domain containing protein n=1 Tax=Trema orientale TaxID=63057 RepID=A0A2P5ETA2_TREOI|nr:hypothetical protein TorRG33x02_154420 [Trema orientale]
MSFCRSKPVLFDIGDSNSDTGGFSIEFGVTIGPPTGISSPCSITQLADYATTFKYELFDPIHAIFEANFTNRGNSTINGPSIQPEGKPFNLDIEIRQFLQFGACSLELISEEFNNALYTIDIGQNDLASSFTDLSFGQVIDQVSFFITMIKVLFGQMPTTS